MKALAATAVTDAVLVSSSVAENDYAAWSSGTTYALGARAVSAHRIYESLSAGNVAHDPATSPDKWLDIGPTNRWAMFDAAAGPRTVAATTISLTLAPATAITAVALNDVTAASVRVRITDGSTTYFDQTVTGGAAAVFLSLPTPAGQQVLVTVTPTGGVAAVGKLLMGGVLDLGQTEASPNIGITDYSRRDTDDFGVTSVVERAWAKRLTARTRVSSTAIDALQLGLVTLRARPALYFDEDQLAPLAIYGYLKDFAIDLVIGDVSFCSLTLDGLQAATGVDSGADPAADGAASDLVVVIPTAVTDGVLTSSSVAETDYAAWAAGTTYAAAARVIRNHRIFESLVAGNVGHDPTTDPTRWLDIGPTNRWAMFDQVLGTATTAATTVTVQLTLATAITALALLDVSGSVRVQATGYDRTIAGPGTRTFFDLTAAAGAVITVTISPSAGSSTVSIGTLLIGTLRGLGRAENAPKVGINDYSVKDTDDFGNTTVVKRGWAKRLTMRSLIASTAADMVLTRVAGLRATAVLWVGSSGFDALAVFGFYRDFSLELGQTVSTCNFTIEGLTEADPPDNSLVTAIAEAATTADYSNIDNLPAAIAPVNILPGGHLDAGQVLYGSGGPPVLSLQPAEAGANVTSTHTAAAISGQGALATLSAAAWGTQITGRPTELTDGRIPAGLDSSGDLARNLTTARANSSALLRYTGGGLFTGELAADITSTHTASAISGQGALATLSAAAWGSQISGRPTELTDGRVSAGLSATGDIARAVPGGRLNISASNIVLDPLFNDTTLWNFATNSAFDTTAAILTAIGAPNRVIKMTAGGGNSQFYSNNFNIVPGQVVIGSWKLLLKSGFSGPMNIAVTFYDKSGAQIDQASKVYSWAVGAVTADTVIDVSTNAYPAPTTAVYCNISIFSGGGPVGANAYAAFPAIREVTSPGNAFLSDTTNLIPDPEFTDLTATWGALPVGWSIAANTTNGQGAGAKKLTIPANKAGSIITKKIPCGPSKTLNTSLYVRKVSGTTSGGVLCTPQFYKADGSFSSVAPYGVGYTAYLDNSTATGRYTFPNKSPSDCAYVAFIIVNSAGTGDMIIELSEPVVRFASVLGDNLVRGDGVTVATENALVTGLGTAASITGQGAGATANNLTGLNATEGAKLSGIQTGADVTLTAAVIPTMPITALTVPTDASGTVTDTTLITFVPSIKKGGASFNSDNSMSYALTLSAGGTWTVDTTNGSSTKSAVTFDPSTMTAAVATTRLTISASGTAIAQYDLSVTKQAVVTSGGTGGGSATSAEVEAAQVTGSTTYASVTAAANPQLIVASGQKLYASYTGSYFITGLSSGTRSGTFKHQYSTDNATWSDFGSSATGTASTVVNSGNLDDYSRTTGSVTLNQSVTVSAGTYYVRTVFVVSSTGRSIRLGGEHVFYEAKP